MGDTINLPGGIDSDSPPPYIAPEQYREAGDVLMVDAYNPATGQYVPSAAYPITVEDDGDVVVMDTSGGYLFIKHRAEGVGWLRAGSWPIKGTPFMPDGGWSKKQLLALGHPADLAHEIVGGTTYEVRGDELYWPGTDMLCARREGDAWQFVDESVAPAGE